MPTHSTQQQVEAGCAAPHKSCLGFFPPTLIHPSSPALIADAQSPVHGVAAAWGGTCLFHGPTTTEGPQSLH